MESIGTLTSGIAHDFNNILFIIKGNIELLMMTDKNEKFDIIIKASNRAIKLIEQITSFSRHDDVELKDVNIKPIIVESINLSKSSISENTSIISDIKDGNYIVKTDEIKIGQVVLNLITNACHAVEDIEGKILISLKNINIHNGDLIKKNLPKGDYAQLKITDNGCGIDPENLDKIFDPYFTTKDISKGTGLGLSIVYGIIKESKGFINVQSELNIGTTFDIFIPLV
jgi:signal transduction histidine kinase